MLFLRLNLRIAIASDASYRTANGARDAVRDAGA
jgi:hypothetical protein